MIGLCGEIMSSVISFRFGLLGVAYDICNKKKCMRKVLWGLLRPRRLERALRAQGLSGSRYRPVAGDLPENARLKVAASSQPLSLSSSPHCIAPASPRSSTKPCSATVGNANKDHACWERPEDMDTPRTVFKIDSSSPGTDVAVETAASLASASLVFRRSDPSYSKLLRRAISVCRCPVVFGRESRSNRPP